METTAAVVKNVNVFAETEKVLNFHSKRREVLLNSLTH